MIWLTAGILFLVYLNAPAVAVRGHGAPFILGALVPMALAIPVGYRVLVRGEPLRFPRALTAAFVMLGLHAVSAFLSDRPFESLETVQTWLTEGVLLALLIANAIRTREEVRAALFALLAAGAAMGAITVAQQVLGPTTHTFAGFGQLDSEIVDEAGRRAVRLAGPIGETNRFAQIMAVLLPIAAAWSLVLEGRRRILCGLAGGLIVIGMAFAFSRGVIVAIGLAIPVALYLGVVRWRHLVLAGVAGVVLLAAMPHYAERVASIGQIVVRTIGLDPTGSRNLDGAARGRLTEMKAAGMLFMDHPVFGAGPGLAPYYYGDYASVVGGKVRTGTRRSHNLYLQLAAETGAIGLSAFAVMVFLCFRDLERARRRFASTDRESWAFVCGVELAIVISLTTSLFLHAAYVRYFWILIGLASATAAQPGTPALAAFLARALGETAKRIRADRARA